MTKSSTTQHPKTCHPLQLTIHILQRVKAKWF